LVSAGAYPPFDVEGVRRNSVPYDRGLQKHSSPLQGTTASILLVQSVNACVFRTLRLLGVGSLLAEASWNASCPSPSFGVGMVAFAAGWMGGEVRTG